jgi:hypothetical protein
MRFLAKTTITYVLETAKSTFVKILVLESEGITQGFFPPFWEFDPYPWNWEISRRFARNWEFLASLGNKKFYCYLLFFLPLPHILIMSIISGLKKQKVQLVLFFHQEPFF